MDQQRLMLRVRVESGIPKLLVKINPSEAEGFSAKNLGEVKLRKASAHRGHVAVLHMSYGVPPGELVMSLKLAEILDVEEEESVELTSAVAAAAAAGGATAERSADPPSSAGTAEAGTGANASARSSLPGSGLPSSGLPASGLPNTSRDDPLLGSRHGSSMRGGREPPDGIGTSPDMSWFLKPDSKFSTRRPAPTDGLNAAPWATSPKAEQAAGSKPGNRQGSYDFDWFRGLGLEQDAPGWRRSRSAFIPSSEQRSENGPAAGSAGSAQLPDPLPRSNAMPEAAAPEWLRDLRAFAEWDVREANRPSVADDFGGARGFRRGSGLHEGGGRADSPWRHLGLNSRTFGGPSDDAAASSADPSNSANESRQRSRAREAEGCGSLPRFEAASDPAREGEEAWPRWPFSWAGDSSGPFSAASLQSGVGPLLGTSRAAEEASLAAGAERARGGRSSYSAEPLSEAPLASASSQSGGQRSEQCSQAASEATPLLAEASHAPRRPASIEGDSLPADDSSDDCRRSKAIPTPADDLGSSKADIGGLSAAADLSAATGDWRRSLERVAAEPSWSHPQKDNSCKNAPLEEDTYSHNHDAHPGQHTSSVWDAPTPQRAGNANVSSHGGQPVAADVAESLEPSPVQSPRQMSRASSRISSRSGMSRTSSCSLEHGATNMLDAQDLPKNAKSVRIVQDSLSQTSSRASSGHSSPPTSSGRERNEPSSSSPPTSSPRETLSEQAQCQQSWQQPRAIVPCRGSSKGSTQKKQSAFLQKRKTVNFGSLHASEEPLALPERVEETRQPVPGRWRPPSDSGGGGLERSELGNEVTTEVRQWLIGETTGPQCSQVVLDRALTVLANFKLASGCQLEVLGGPLGAIVGGYSDADWLYDEVFRKQPGEAIREAFMLLGFRGRADGDWSSIAAEEVSLAYRRLCLRGHPSRGGAPRSYLKLQVAMELIRAFAGEAGPLERTKERTPTATPASASSQNGDDCTPSSRFGIGRTTSKTECTPPGFVLNDVTLVRELQLTAAQAEEEAGKIPQEQLEEMNRALDEYILRQMCFKSEIVDEIARLHEDCAYAILGVSSDATDGEIKKAYRLIAMQCHPDKGGDKEDFQELNNAYEKIMEQRRSTTDPFGQGAGEEEPSDDEKQEAPPKKERRAEKEKSEKAEKEEGAEEEAPEGDEEVDKTEEPTEEGEDDEYGEEGSNASLIEKSGKAAEEASRYAKTAAEFAHQAAEAAETARRGREQGSRDTLTKSIAHSAIVLTLTVVKAVRVVGYATLDVAAQCRIAAKRNPEAVGCAERAVTAMSLGLEALNAALACAEVTETTAAELQAPAPATEGGSGGSSTAAAERFVGAAVRASLAAASASNAAMSAAIAAVEGSRECAKAVEEQQANAASKDKVKDGERNDEEAEEAEEADCEADEEEATAEPKPARPPPPTPEEAAAAATKRLVAQRNNNHKVLQRLNAEILGHQQNVRQFLAANRQLIPNVTGESKTKIFGLLQDYAAEARWELERFSCPEESHEPFTTEELLSAIRDQSMLTPFAQDQAVAIPVSVKARVLKMAALYDLSMTMQVLEREIFAPIRAVLPKDDSEAREKTDALCTRIQEELKLSSE